jgi:hypothetical protein
LIPVRLTASQQLNWIKATLTRVEQALKHPRVIPAADRCGFAGLPGF